jgi:hypothetical protein
MIYFAEQSTGAARAPPEISMSAIAPSSAPSRFVVRGRGLTIPRLLGLAVFALPGAGFVAALLAVRDRPEFAFLWSPRHWPWELTAIAACGLLGLAGGIGDFFWHVRGLRDVSRREERGEIVALACGGAPLFFLLLAASASLDPRPFLFPVVALAMAVTTLVCHDEFVYHRKACGKTETLFHRLLTLGNGAAFLAWFHWVFVRVRVGG